MDYKNIVPVANEIYKKVINSENYIIIKSNWLKPFDNTWFKPFDNTIIKLNDKICKDVDEAIDLIKSGNNFKLSITLENGVMYTVEYVDGIEYWYKDGMLHREDGPAMTYENGTTVWYKDDKIHREDGPAVEYVDGTKVWYKEGLLHREDGPAYVSTHNLYWYINGLPHRTDGPAIESSNGKFYYINGFQQNDN